MWKCGSPGLNKGIAGIAGSRRQAAGAAFAAGCPACTDGFIDDISSLLIFSDSDTLCETSFDALHNIAIDASVNETGSPVRTAHAGFDVIAATAGPEEDVELPVPDPSATRA